MKTIEQLQSIDAPKSYGLLRIFVVDKAAIRVQPIDAEAYESPARICDDCISLAQKFNHPVCLYDKTGHSVTILP